ncbi:hypothetical protein F66182_10386 [Fusarium sp. NRRL 66182]|nr:hypothetical protein F66182_10386 [Fusarium sp. NRRL 66182]
MTQSIKTSFLDKSKFYKSWRHPEKTAKIKSIYLANSYDIGQTHRGRRFYTYLAGGTYKRMYHGATRACQIGQSGHELTLCNETACQICGILRESFKLRYANDEGMFGAGIYSTPTSSKADVYAKNHYINSNLHAVLICYVIANSPEHKYEADSDITHPSRGFDCIQGMTEDQGGDLKYPEFVVYREDAIIPVGLVMYTREGWTY